MRVVVFHVDKTLLKCDSLLIAAKLANNPIQLFVGIIKIIPFYFLWKTGFLEVKVFKEKFLCIFKICEKFNIPFDRFLTNIDRVGNTSAAAIPIILSEENKNQTFKQGDILYLIGFGAGFTWAGILLEWSN